MDHNGNYLENASISVGGIDKTIHSNKNGAFWRLLLPGQYTVEVSAEGYEPVTSKVHDPKSRITPGPRPENNPNPLTGPGQQI